MKRILFWNLLFLTVAFILSVWINGYCVTLQYWMCDYIGYGLILTAQRMLKEKDPASFPVYIIGLTFNLVFGIMNKSFIHVLFCIYSIGIFIDNWRTWVNKKT